MSSPSETGSRSSNVTSSCEISIARLPTSAMSSRVRMTFMLALDFVSKMMVWSETVSGVQYSRDRDIV